MGIIKYANTHCLDLFEEDSLEKIQGLSLGNYVHPEDLPILANAIRKGAEEKAFHSVLNVRVVSRTGRITGVETKSSTIHYHGEECRLVIASNLDRIGIVEEELRNKNLLIDKIAQIMPDSFILVGSKSRKVLFENKSLLEMLGYTAEDIGDKDAFEFIASIINRDDIQKLVDARKFLSDPANDGKYISSEYRLKDKSGQWRWIQGRSTVFRRLESDGEQINFGISQDITLQKRTEEKLREASLLVEKVTATLPNHISIFDIERNQNIYDNFFFGSILGYTREDTPADWFQLVHPESREQAKHIWSSVPNMEDGDILNAVITYMTKNGGKKYMLTRLTPFQRNSHGHVSLILNTTIDITDLKQAELALAKSEETMRAVLMALPDLVFLVNTDGVITDFYPNAEVQGAMSTFRFIHRNIADFVPPHDLENVKKLIRDAASLRKVQTYELSMEGGNGDQFIFEFRIFHLHDNEVVVIARDITNLRRTREQLNLRVEELSQSNMQLEKYITSNAELEKFAYIASHDLREPIRSIVGFAQLLQKKNEDALNSDSLDYLNTIIQSAQRMNSLVHGLLDYSRINAEGKPFVQVDLNDTLKKVRSDLIASLTESGGTILSDKLPMITCDELQIRQLFQNLISNSIKFRSNQPPVIQISAEKEGHNWVLCFRDNGIGLDMKYREKVFEIFTRLNNIREYPGSGIGLSLCKRIVERHFGRIWIDSAPGKGTSVFFSIPE